MFRFFESRWRFPQTVTLLVEIPDESIASAVQQILALCENHPFRLLERVHFVRMVVLEATVDLRGNRIPGRILINAVFDYSAGEFFVDFARVLGEQLVQLLKLSPEFKELHTANVASWMEQKATQPATYHVGTLLDDLAVVRQESQLQMAIEQFMDQQQLAGAWVNADPTKIQRDVLEFVRSRPELPQTLRQPRTWRSRVFQTLDLLSELSLLALPPFSIATALVWLLGMSWWSWWWVSLATIVTGFILLAILIRWYEVTEGDFVVTPKPGQTRQLVEDEDFGVQNQITLVIPVRDSRFRRLTIRIVLWIANSVSKHWYQIGSLAGIDTIHFARFHLIDGGKRMVFISDFDGGWERYLFDFLGVGSLAVVPIWSSLHGCPKARLLRFPTEGFAPRFLAFTRAQQIRTHFNYSAVPHLTVSEIKRNAKMRSGLFRTGNRSQIQRWLDLF